MSTKSWINCAFLVVAAYSVLLHVTDGAAIRHRRRKTEQGNNIVPKNSSVVLQHGKIEKQQLHSVATDNRTYSKISSYDNTKSVRDTDNRIDAVIHNDVGKIENATESTISKLKTVSQKRTKEANVHNDFDSNDNNGAGDGVEELDTLQNESKRKVGDREQLLKEKKVSKEFSQIFQFSPADDKRNVDVVDMTKSINLTSRVTSLIPLKVDELQPPDHVDGLRMEHDGHLNRDYKKEILLGNHEEFEWESEPKLVNRLKDIFHKADVDRNGFLDVSELKGWIMLNVQRHLKEAAADNRRIFSHLDTNNDGFVTWKEFYVHFLMAKGYDLESAQQQSEDYDRISLDPDEKEKVIRYKFRWAEADEEPQDNRLTFTELMNFRHPEQSKTMLGRMVKDLIENFDRNEDEVITEDEFALLPLGEVDANKADGQEWLIERKREFREVIDLNKDGIVDEAELKIYVDPHNSNHAKLEAENLIHLADQNADGRLTLNEVLENAELFLGSKMVDASRNFHDEF